MTPGPYTAVDLSMIIIPATADNPIAIWRIVRISLLRSTGFWEMCFFLLVFIVLAYSLFAVVFFATQNLCVMEPGISTPVSVAGIEDAHKGLLWDLDLADGLHTFFALFLFVKQLIFSSNVAAVKPGYYVLSERFDRFAGDDFASDGHLQRNLKLMPRDGLTQLDEQLPASLLGHRAVKNPGQGIDRRLVDEDVDFDKVGGLEPDERIIHSRVAVTNPLEVVIKIIDDFYKLLSY